MLFLTVCLCWTEHQHATFCRKTETLLPRSAPEKVRDAHIYRKSKLGRSLFASYSDCLILAFGCHLLESKTETRWTMITDLILFLSIFTVMIKVLKYECYWHFKFPVKPSVPSLSCWCDVRELPSQVFLLSLQEQVVNGVC